MSMNQQKLSEFHRVASCDESVAYFDSYGVEHIEVE